MLFMLYKEHIADKNEQWHSKRTVGKALYLNCAIVAYRNNTINVTALLVN